MKKLSNHNDIRSTMYDCVVLCPVDLGLGGYTLYDIVARSL